MAEFEDTILDHFTLQPYLIYCTWVFVVAYSIRSSVNLCYQSEQLAGSEKVINCDACLLDRKLARSIRTVYFCFVELAAAPPKLHPLVALA
jgi:hypothetical protein